MKTESAVAAKETDRCTAFKFVATLEKTFSMTDRESASLYRVLDKFDDADRDLLAQVKNVEWTCASVRRSIAAGAHVNGLGALQSSALSFDRACILRETFAEQAIHFAAILGDDSLLEAVRTWLSTGITV